MGKALINGITAFNNGVEWIDSTVTGMGRGPETLKQSMRLLNFQNLEKNERQFFNFRVN